MQSLYQKLQTMWTYYESKQTQAESKVLAKAKLGL